jgi:putative transposase
MVEKKIKGRKRHILVDTMGLIHCLKVHEANIQDRDGALLLLQDKSIFEFPRLKKLWLDSGYAGRCKKWLEERFSWDAEIVRRPGEGHSAWVWCPKDEDPPMMPRGFQVVKRRWVVERTFGWLGRWRRLSKDFEKKIKTSETMIYIAMTGLMLRRLAI